MLNKTLSGYTILRLLGKGGMADVYYAENNLHRPAAIKVLNKAMTDMPEVRSRFEHEARIIVKLDHPNIRKVYDVAEVEGRPAIVMEYLDGFTLSEALARHSISASDLPRLFDQAVSGLQYAHSRSVVHRDIKPSNLFLTSSGELKILDFGIAKVEEASTHTLTGQTLGTILYMSPEQVEDPKRVDYHTDIYSLGVTFYHLITGKPPYDLSTDSSFKIQLKIVKDDLDLSSLSKDWYTRLAPCLRKNANSRYFPEVDSLEENSRGPLAETSKVKIGPANETGKFDLKDDGSTIIMSGSEPTSASQQIKDAKDNRRILVGAIVFISLILVAVALFLFSNKEEKPIQEIFTFSGYQYSIIRRGDSDPIPLNSYVFFNMSLSQKDSVLQSTATIGKPSVLKLTEDNKSFGQLKALVDVMGTLHKGDSLNFYFPIDSFERLPPGFEKFNEPIVYHVGIVDVMDEAKYKTYSDSIDAITRSQETKISHDDEMKNERYLSQFSDNELSSEYEYSERMDNGNLIVAIGGKNIEPCRANGFREYEGGKWGIVSSQGNLLYSVNCNYLSSSCVKGFIEIVTYKPSEGFSSGLVSNSGKLVLQPTCDRGFSETNGGFIIYMRNGKFGVVSKAGTSIFPAKYDYIEEFLGNQFLMIEGNSKKYLFATGELILDISEYDCTRGINSNYVIVSNSASCDYEYFYCSQTLIPNGKMGVINLNKQILIPLSYDYICFVSPRKVIVNEGGKIEVGSEMESSSFSGGRWGYINLDNPNSISWIDRQIDWDYFQGKEINY